MFYGDYFRSDWRLGERYSGQFNGLVTSLNGIEVLTGLPGPAAAATPEPSTLLLTAIGLSVGFKRRRGALRSE